MTTIEQFKAAKTKEEFIALIQTPQDLANGIVFLRLMPAEETFLNKANSSYPNSPFGNILKELIDSFVDIPFKEEMELQERRKETIFNLTTALGDDWRDKIKEVL